MKISLFSLLDHYPAQGISLGRRYRDAVARAARAETLGYDGLWFAEHHFRDFGALPNPAVLLVAVAQCTRRARLGPAVAVLPFRHPLQVAEDYLIVDQLSEGRLQLGVGSGIIEWEFAGLGLDIADKAERFREALDVLRPLLRGEPGGSQSAFMAWPVQGPPALSENSAPSSTKTKRSTPALIYACTSRRRRCRNSWGYVRSPTLKRFEHRFRSGVRRQDVTPRV